MRHKVLFECCDSPSRYAYYYHKDLRRLLSFVKLIFFSVFFIELDALLKLHMHRFWGAFPISSSSRCPISACDYFYSVDYWCTVVISFYQLIMHRRHLRVDRHWGEVNAEESWWICKFHTFTAVISWHFWLLFDELLYLSSHVIVYVLFSPSNKTFSSNNNILSRRRLLIDNSHNWQVALVQNRTCQGRKYYINIHTYSTW